MQKFIKYTFLSCLFITTSCLKEDDGVVDIPPLEGSTLSPEVGGASQPNQVWVDLSNQELTTAHRNDWDLGFYTGDDFYVILNNSILMAAGSIEATDIDAVNESDFIELLEILDPASGFPETYIDDVSGNYEENGTAIEKINAIDAENKVYLLKMGYKVSEDENIPPFSTYTIGDTRGFKKVRILRNDENSYKLQYADLNETQHIEVIIPKEADYHFTFYSIVNEMLATIQPKKQEWDLCFTVMNNVIEGYGTYIYSDFVNTNNLSNVGVYEIVTDALTLEEDYNNFTLENVNESLLEYDDQRVIGSKWRSTVSGTTSTPVVKGDRFYILKDAEGLLFKLRFLSMLSPDNERGFPQFEYEPL